MRLTWLRLAKLKVSPIEFRAQKERRDNGLRVVESALLAGVAIVPNPSYPQSQVEARNARHNDLWRLL